MSQVLNLRQNFSKPINFWKKEYLPKIFNILNIFLIINKL